jgi:hypothetical protein
MTFVFSSTAANSLLKCISGAYIPPRSTIGEEGGGATGIQYEPISEKESSENSTLLEKDCGSIQWYTKLTIYELIGCGAEGLQLREIMKNEWQSFSMNSLEDFFENYERKSQE